MLTVLILEDDPLIALDTAATVEDDGNAKVLMAGTLTEASKVNLGELDVAILDVNIGAQTSYAFARQLLDAGIPFAFASGSQQSAAPNDLSAAPFLAKPCSRSKILAFIALSANVARRSLH
jgi:CheY-like chemotaxis protein